MIHLSPVEWIVLQSENVRALHCPDEVVSTHEDSMHCIIELRSEVKLFLGQIKHRSFFQQSSAKMRPTTKLPLRVGSTVTSFQFDTVGRVRH